MNDRRPRPNPTFFMALGILSGAITELRHPELCRIVEDFHKYLEAEYELSDQQRGVISQTRGYIAQARATWN